ncbi:MAG: hypothetical protein ACRD4R_17505 [Candidatus Acidiferrales bacterium]
MTRAMQQEIEALKTEVASLQRSMATSQSDALKLSLRVFQLESDKHQTVDLDLTSRNYLRIDTDQGMFLVAVQNVEPYLDGYKITLDVGNTSSATFHGFKLHSEWNTKYDWTHYTEASFDSWQKETRKRDDSFPEVLYPGRWNAVEVLLPSTSAGQLGFFEVSMETSEVSLQLPPATN